MRLEVARRKHWVLEVFRVDSVGERDIRVVVNFVIVFRRRLVVRCQCRRREVDLEVNLSWKTSVVT